MRESPLGFHNLEWPPAHSTVAGPILWLRGWVVAHAGIHLVDVRVRYRGAVHLGILGLPRTDLAEHFKSPRPWLPAEYIIGLPIDNGAHRLTVEVMDGHGGWHELEAIELTVAPDGTPPPRVEGRLEASPDGTWTMRDPHHPFQGHLDQPGACPKLKNGRARVFGWLLDESSPLRKVIATTDLLSFNHLDHSRTDEALAQKFPQFPGAKRARLQGWVEYPRTVIEPACLRVYAQGPDGSVTLCFAQRLRATQATSNATESPRALTAPVARDLPALPSGRPRRLLMFVRTLMPADATLRALDIARHLTQSYHWAVRLVSTEDGILRDTFFTVGVESLIVEPTGFFNSTNATQAAENLHRLGQRIRWDHLDAVAIFDPLCGWALGHARERGIPSVFDCGETVPLTADPTAIPEVQVAMRNAWQSATAICYSSSTAATAQNELPTQATIIPFWHSPTLPEKTAERVAVAPLSTITWLHHFHPEVAKRWNFLHVSATDHDAEQLAQQDATSLIPAVQTTSWQTPPMSLMLGPLFAHGSIRAVLDALAVNVPAITVCSNLTQELFGDSRLPQIEEGNPMALVHTLLAYDAAPEFLHREAARMGDAIRRKHSPADLLPQWEALLNTVAATRG